MSGCYAWPWTWGINSTPLCPSSLSGLWFKQWPWSWNCLSRYLTPHRWRGRSFANQLARCFLLQWNSSRSFWSIANQDNLASANITKASRVPTNSYFVNEFTYFYLFKLEITKTQVLLKHSWSLVPRQKIRWKNTMRLNYYLTRHRSITDHPRKMADCLDFGKTFFGHHRCSCALSSPGTGGTPNTSSWALEK